METDKLRELVAHKVNEYFDIGREPDNVEIPDSTELASRLEYTLLNPDTAEEQIVAALRLTKDLRLANICISPYYVSIAAEYLQGTNSGICVPVGFPHGAASTAAKTAEIRECIKNGATEFDAEINILAVKSGKYEDAKKDLEEMCSMAQGRAKIKAIYEQSLFTEEEKKKVLEMMLACFVDYVKISNALTGNNACAEDVEFTRSIVGDKMGIKIDGGIRSADFAAELIRAGADRFGVSKPAEILA